MEVEEERLDKRGRGGGKSYLSRAVARAWILNNFYRAREESEDVAPAEHAKLYIYIHVYFFTCVCLCILA